MAENTNRKERIILTTIEIIDELGFQGLTTKEICRRQEFSEGSLYKHFRSKNDIILGVLDYYSKWDNDVKQTIEMQKFSSRESIIYCVTRWAEYYEDYPAMTAIVNSYETLRNEAGVAQKAKEIFESRSGVILHLVEEGINNGEFWSDIDGMNLSNIIWGSCIATTLEWRMEQRSFKLKERLLSTLDVILKAY